ncbi:MAG: UDP-N-acetylmuramoyl-tripeptide--D-alanyl-D-alanine ligase [Bacteroidetes bacterium]|nr:UDP-N-acetylmuramoyl-tripeptide--D-alanyl-D-alanine ligase [Bacteroidota bacterium]
MTFSTDTRTLQPGDIYVAIRGEVYDGHDFILQAIEKGAAGIVTEVDVEAPENVEVIYVESTLDYLTRKASKKVRQHAPDVVAITGSVGKTSTKTAVHAVLAEAFDVVASEGNKNTPLGLSLTLLKADFDSETKLVLEMGARLKGDIKELCSHFPPTVSIVTNVKGVHVETFESIEGVQREKSEIVRALDGGGTACLNGDDPHVRAMAGHHRGTTLFYGKGEACDIRPEHIITELPILGDHAVYTALAACTAGRALGMSFEAVNRGLANIQPEKGRLARLRGRNDSVLIDDTYNASPEATLAALDVLCAQKGERYIAFLGDMLELGDTEVEEHARVLAAAVESVDAIHAVGPIMARAAETLPAGQQARIMLQPASSDLAEALRAGHFYEPQPGDVILVKGSQGTRMERVSEALLHPNLNPEDMLPRQSESWKQIV